jgi:Domain of unknown function (DUF4159)
MSRGADFGRKVPQATLPLVGGLLLLAVAAIGLTQTVGVPGPLPRHEFQIARLIYDPVSGDNRRAWRPWWAIDYPEAEYHVTQGLRRLTRLHSADDSVHLRADDPRLFDYPWLFAQQVGRWYLSDAEALGLREYLLRGGFLVADDFHGDQEYEIFLESMRRVFPDLPIVDLEEGDPLLHVIYDISERTQIPGKRHLYRDGSGQIRVNPDGTPPMWKGILDERGRLMVVMNFNMDMGDSWEHADDPEYPQAMTALGYRFGINYIMYAMTH